MAERAFPAIKTRCDVSADGSTWLEINGLLGASPKPNPKEITTFMRHNKGQAQTDRIGWDFKAEFTGNRLVGTEGGARDSAQKMIEDACFANTSLYFRIMDPDETTELFGFEGVPDMTAMGEGGESDYGNWAFNVSADPGWTYYGAAVE